MAYSAKLNYEVFEYVTCEPLPFYVIKLYHGCDGEILKKECFSWLKVKLAITISE